MTEDMVEWHHRLNGHEFEQALGDGDEQGSLACCSPWGHKELDMTESLNSTRQEGGPAQSIYFLFSKSGYLPEHMCAEGVLGGQKGVMLTNGGLPRGLCGRIQLDREMCAYIREDPEIYKIWSVNQANQND